MSYVHQGRFDILRSKAAKRFLISITAFLFVWQLFSMVFPLGVASPYATALYVTDLLLHDSSLVIGTVSISLFRIVIGFLLALSIGTGVGVLMGLSEEGEGYVYVIVLIGMMVPSLSWAMISLVIFGLTETAIIIAITATTTPFITVSIWEGVKDIDLTLVEMAAVFDLSQYSTIRHVIIPQITPYLFSASRYGLGLAWKIAVVVELLGASSGVGFMLNQSFNFASLEGVFAWTVIIVIIMVVIEYGIIRSVEHLVLGWRNPVRMEGAQ